MNNREAIDWLCTMPSAQMYIVSKDNKAVGVTIRIRNTNKEKFDGFYYPNELKFTGETFLDAVIGVRAKMYNNGFHKE